MAGEALREPVAPKAPRSSAKVFDCPSCGAGIALRAQGHSISAVCRSCGSVVDTSDENYQIISKVKKQQVEPLIPLGQRGKLHGVLWEVIGYMARSDASGAYPWTEYLLFNPSRGFRWLSEFDGHWNYITPTKEKPIAKAAGNRTAVNYLGRTFHLFHEGSARVNYVLGEFYWRVKVNESVRVQDFVSPPEVLSRETRKDEVIWSVGEYVEPETIKAAFQITAPMPLRIGVSPNQPSTVSPQASAIGKYWRYFLAIIIAIQCFSWFVSHNEDAYHGTFSSNGSEPQTIEVTPPFELKHGTSNVAFKLFSPVDNGWLELGVDLVNDGTGATYSFEQGVEHYSGYDSDGSWSEGSRDSEKTLALIPDGTYHLNIQATGTHTQNKRQQTYSLVVVRDPPSWSNFFLAFFVISIVPVIAWWRSRSFEKARWSTSDFSPYWSSSDEE